MSTKAPKPDKPDPATVASSVSEQAKRQQELASRRKAGFYGGFKNVQPTTPTGGGNQTLG